VRSASMFACFSHVRCHDCRSVASSHDSVNQARASGTGDGFATGAPATPAADVPRTSSSGGKQAGSTSRLPLAGDQAVHDALPDDERKIANAAAPAAEDRTYTEKLSLCSLVAGSKALPGIGRCGYSVALKPAALGAKASVAPSPVDSASALARATNDGSATVAASSEPGLVPSETAPDARIPSPISALASTTSSNVEPRSYGGAIRTTD